MYVLDASRLSYVSERHVHVGAFQLEGVLITKLLTGIPWDRNTTAKIHAQDCFRPILRPGRIGIGCIKFQSAPDI